MPKKRKRGHGAADAAHAAPSKPCLHCQQPIALARKTCSHPECGRAQQAANSSVEHVAAAAWSPPAGKITARQRRCGVRFKQFSVPQRLAEHSCSEDDSEPVHATRRYSEAEAAPSPAHLSAQTPPAAPAPSSLPAAISEPATASPPAAPIEYDFGGCDSGYANESLPGSPTAGPDAGQVGARQEAAAKEAALESYRRQLRTWEAFQTVGYSERSVCCLALHGWCPTNYGLLVRVRQLPCML